MVCSAVRAWHRQHCFLLSPLTIYLNSSPRNKEAFCSSKNMWVWSQQWLKSHGDGAQSCGGDRRTPWPPQWLLWGAPGIPPESKAIILLQHLGCSQVTYFSHHKEDKLMPDRLGILDLKKKKKREQTCFHGFSKKFSITILGEHIKPLKAQSKISSAPFLVCFTKLSCILQTFLHDSFHCGICQWITQPRNVWDIPSVQLGRTATGKQDKATPLNYSPRKIYIATIYKIIIR